MNCFGLKEYISVDCKYQDLFIEYCEILSNIEIIYKKKTYFPRRSCMYFLNSVKKLIITGATINLESLFKKNVEPHCEKKNLFMSVAICQLQVMYMQRHDGKLHQFSLQVYVFLMVLIVPTEAAVRNSCKK